MKVSIIVPVFNVEDYLESCLSSLVPALKKEDEVLLVQGPSTDRSCKIAAEFQKNHPQIRIIGQNGIGLSNARNCGLKAAEGEVILFIDGDDFVDSIALAELLQQIREDEYSADVWLTDYYKCFGSRGRHKLVSQIGMNQVSTVDGLVKLLPKHSCFWNVWKNAYRREFLVNNELFFIENSYAEDIDFITRLLILNPRVQTKEIPYYHYRMNRRGSLMNRVSLARIQSTVSVLENCVQRLRDERTACFAPLITSFQFEYLLNMALVQEVDPQQKKLAVDAFCKFKEVLSPATDCAVRCGAFCVQVIGVSKVSKVLWGFKQIKRRVEHREK